MIKSEEMLLNMGPQHPSTHGVLRLKITTDGEIVSKIEPVIGYLHRCFEKHCEHLTYEQIIPYTDRCDYIASMHMDHAYVLAMETLMKIEVPERVSYIRIIVGELQRIASHLVALGTFGLDIGAITPFTWMIRDRERILDLFEYLCGARLLYNYIWIGGVSHDLPAKFIDRTKEFIDYFKPQMDEFDQLLTFNKIFIERTADVGIMPPEVAINYGVTGPSLRGSGVKWDLRKNEPYSLYDRMEFDVPVGDGRMGSVGDCWDRYWVRMLEMRESVRIIEQALKEIPSGDVKAAIPKRIRPPKGSIYTRFETARGEAGFYIISNGKNIPTRLKMRSPAFCNLSVISEIAEGWMLSDVIAILGSLDIVLGEIDR
ncbi:MAG: NADH-quinone oxidoreductase subunit D [Candidatus Marinimicrobia bacterium]|nr:NADH-quinone oxidoreductase subunit D [Candidatus Neomarinimicrobiota bacterium]MBT3682658.1 NADH-quinone oxidoreductase subunit D [Candidatus Neomarinimicrobiota bacterium]MBT3759687.1 NADH-quinone oxidoreductase subunit D [Candidatus Neomarinimicrobiota bacterium]MBT3894442.1 NADH-quinone oxidoreductase subunit D [Candidatus Neomarinimicrobiota bacterium]MBT4172484.1 NADH-quinone oxidoreductase subunit D [Candidatus Neomarinimicrobiota bacterium]